MAETREAPKDTPVIFSGAMVNALLSGRKTQTRQLATSPLAKVRPGDRLYVRENFQLLSFGDYAVTKAQPCDVRYAATDPLADLSADVRGYPWRPSIHMPRFASRITLVVTAVKVERLQDISEADAVAEGIERMDEPVRDCWFRDPTFEDGAYVPTAVMGFEFLWRHLHDDDAWTANPLVVAVSFTVHRANIDSMPALESTHVG
jgi:hypothetical protein